MLRHNVQVSRVCQSIEQLLVLRVDRGKPRSMTVFGELFRCGCEFAARTPLSSSPLK